MFCSTEQKWTSIMQHAVFCFICQGLSLWQRWWIFTKSVIAPVTNDWQQKRKTSREQRARIKTFVSFNHNQTRAWIQFQTRTFFDVSSADKRSGEIQKNSGIITDITSPRWSRVDSSREIYGPKLGFIHLPLASCYSVYRKDERCWLINCNGFRDASSSSSSKLQMHKKILVSFSPSCLVQ